MGEIAYRSVESKEPEYDDRPAWGPEYTPEGLDDEHINFVDDNNFDDFNDQWEC